MLKINKEQKIVDSSNTEWILEKGDRIKVLNESEKSETISEITRELQGRLDDSFKLDSNEIGIIVTIAKKLGERKYFIDLDPDLFDDIVHKLKDFDIYQKWLDKIDQQIALFLRIRQKNR